MKLKRTGDSDKYFTKGKEYEVRDRYIVIEDHRLGHSNIRWKESHIKILLKNDLGHDFKLGQYSYEPDDYFYGINFWNNWEITDTDTSGLTFKDNLYAGKGDRFWQEYLGVICGLGTFGVVALLLYFISLASG